jgi:hypothetical protein
MKRKKISVGGDIEAAARFAELVAVRKGRILAQDLTKLQAMTFKALHFLNNDSMDRRWGTGRNLVLGGLLTAVTDLFTVMKSKTLKNKRYWLMQMAESLGEAYNDARDHGLL